MSIEFRGIKCDNPKCDFIDMTVEYKDYKGKWLNKPCPKCGDNLLTKADMQTCKDLTETVNKLKIFDKLEGEKFSIPIKMDGSGKIEF